MIIGFSEKTKKILPKIFCKKFRHCAAVKKISANKFVFIHKVKYGTQSLVLSSGDLKILENNGWEFIKYKVKKDVYKINNERGTCVSLVKNQIGLNKPFIITPYQLYKYLIAKNKGN